MILGSVSGIQIWDLLVGIWDEDLKMGSGLGQAEILGSGLGDLALDSRGSPGTEPPDVRS
jgi:hypothetical protein